MVYTSIAPSLAQYCSLAVPGEKECSASLIKTTLTSNNKRIANSTDKQQVSSEHQMTIFGPDGVKFRKIISEVTLTSSQLAPLVQEAQEKITILNNPKTFLRISRDTKCQLLNWLNDHYQILKGLKRDDIPRINLDTCAYYVNHVDRHVRIAMWPLLAQVTEGKKLAQKQLKSFLSMAGKDNWQNDAATDRYIQQAMVSLAELHPATYKIILEILKKKKIVPRQRVPNNLPENLTFGLEIEVAAIKYVKKMYYKKTLKPDIKNTHIMFEDWTETIEKAKQQGLIREDNDQSYFWNVRLEEDLEHFETKTPILNNKFNDWRELCTVIYLLRQKMHSWQSQGIQFVHTIHINVGGYPLDAKTLQAVNFIFKAMEYWWKELVGVKWINQNRLLPQKVLLGDLADYKHRFIVEYNPDIQTLAFNLFPPVFLKATDESAWALYQKKITIALNVLYKAVTAPELFNLLSWGLPVTQDNQLPESKKNHILRHALDKLYGQDTDGKLDFLQLFVATSPSYTRKSAPVAVPKVLKKDHTGRNIYRKVKLEHLYEAHFNANGWKDQSRLDQRVLVPQWKRKGTNSENYYNSMLLLILFHPSHDVKEKAFSQLTDLIRESVIKRKGAKALLLIALTGGENFSSRALEYLLNREIFSARVTIDALVSISSFHPHITVALKAYNYLETMLYQPDETDWPDKKMFILRLFSRKLSKSIHPEIRMKTFLLLKGKAVNQKISLDERKKAITALIEILFSGTDDVVDQVYSFMQEMLANQKIHFSLKYYILDQCVMSRNTDYMTRNRILYRISFLKCIVLTQKGLKRNQQLLLRNKALGAIMKVIEYCNYKSFGALEWKGIQALFDIAKEGTLPKHIRLNAISEIKYHICDQLLNYLRERDVHIAIMALKLLMNLALTYQGYRYKEIRIKIHKMLYKIMVDVTQTAVKQQIFNFFNKNKKEINSIHKTETVTGSEEPDLRLENINNLDKLRSISFEKYLQISH